MTLTTTPEQIRALDDRIVREALEQLRREADRQEIVSRVYQVPEEAVEAMRLARLRVAWLRGER